MLDTKREVPLDQLYAIAIMAVMAEHQDGLTEAQLEMESTEWLRAAKQTLATAAELQ